MRITRVTSVNHWEGQANRSTPSPRPVVDVSAGRALHQECVVCCVLVFWMVPLSEVVFTLGDAWTFSGSTSKMSRLGSMLNFDADVKKTTARHQCETRSDTSFHVFHARVVSFQRTKHTVLNIEVGGRLRTLRMRGNALTCLGLQKYLRPRPK